MSPCPPGTGPVVSRMTRVIGHGPRPLDRVSLLPYPVVDGLPGNLPWPGLDRYGSGRRGRDSGSASHCLALARYRFPTRAGPGTRCCVFCRHGALAPGSGVAGAGLLSRKPVRGRPGPALRWPALPAPVDRSSGPAAHPLPTTRPDGPIPSGDGRALRSHLHRPRHDKGRSCPPCTPLLLCCPILSQLHAMNNTCCPPLTSSI